MNEEPPGQMVNPDGMAGPGVGAPGVYPVCGAKLHDSVEPHERQRLGERGKGGGKVDMAPERVSYGFGITIQKGGVDLILHYFILTEISRE